MRARAVVREQLFASNHSNMEADIWLHWIVYNNMRTLPWSLCVCVVAWTLQKHTQAVSEISNARLLAMPAMGRRVWNISVELAMCWTALCCAA